MERLKGYTTLPFHSTLRVLHLQVESAMLKDEFSVLSKRLLELQLENAQKMENDFQIIAVRLRVKKKVQNLNAMWYKEFAKNFATQGDFGHESP